jgi:hypothetical protein
MWRWHRILTKRGFFREAGDPREGTGWHESQRYNWSAVVLLPYEEDCDYVRLVRGTGLREKGRKRYL